MPRSNFALIWTLTASAIALALPTSTVSTIPRVSDPVTGVTYHGNLSSGVESFLNIRFAEDTSGSNRFALPKSFDYPKHTVVNATQIGNACPQADLTSGEFSVDAKAYSEDCLTVRIDRLENTTASSNLPVMVYLFGGGFTSGQIYDPAFNPTGLLKSAEASGSPVIYAAVNFRVSIWGLAVTPALAANHSLNPGLYDQRLGLEWVKANIQSFGGNPNNITIFGESSGAISVSHQITAFGGSEVPFHRAIMQSGASTACAGTTGSVNRIHTLAIAKRLNCTSSNSQEQLDCLRSVPLDAMLPIVSHTKVEINPNNGLLVWIPTAPSKFLPDAPSKLLRSGRFAKNIDLISGWNENDGSIFILPNITTDAEAVYSVVHPAALDVNTTKELLSLYPLSDFAPAQSGNVTATAQFFRAAQMFRDNSFLCSSLLLQEAMANFSDASWHSYLFDLNTTLTTPLEQADNTTYLRVDHGSDIPFVFNTLASVPSATTAQRQLADEMSASWAAFTSRGNVSHGADTVSGWTKGYTGKDKALDVRVLGGPHAGMAAINDAKTGVLASQDLARRCAFWTSQTVSDQLQT